MTWDLQDLHARTSLGRISPGPPQDPLFWTCGRRPKPGQQFCASLRSRNAHGHLTTAMLRENLLEKCRAPRPGQPRGQHFVRACAVQMHRAHGHLTRATLGKCRPCPRPQDQDNRFAQACAVELHVEMSQEQFYARILGEKTGIVKTPSSRESLQKNAGDQSERAP